jgi:hypothetical protein
MRFHQRPLALSRLTQRPNDRRSVRLFDVACLVLLAVLVLQSSKCFAGTDDIAGGHPIAGCEGGTAAENRTIQSADALGLMNVPMNLPISLPVNLPVNFNDQPVELSIPPITIGLPYSVDQSFSVSGNLVKPKGVDRRMTSARCVLFNQTLCGAMKNKPVLALAMLQTAALISDGVTTRQYLDRGYVEVDPLTKILIGSKPTWARMAPLGMVQVFAGMWLAQQMAGSQHVWVRRLRWLPQIAGIAANTAAAAHNAALP